jgi:Mrp family chromosome partitioning ATPase
MNKQPQTPVRTPFVRSFARTLATQSPEQKNGETRLTDSWLNDDQTSAVAIGDAAHPVPGPSYIAPALPARTPSPSAPMQRHTQGFAQDPIVEHERDHRRVTQQTPNFPTTRIHTVAPSTQTEIDSPSVSARQSEAPRVDDKPLQKQAYSETITPVWEVDVFEIPSTVADLFFEGKLFADLGARISEAAMGGLRSMLVTSTDSGEGRSTIAIGMALAAAAGGLKVALVDADVQSPTLVDDLRLDIQYGWIESIRNGLPIGEIAVHSIEDNITLIPLLPASSSQPEPNPAETIQLIERLSDHFDMIIIDGPPSDSAPLYRLAPIVDSAVIVCDVARISPNTIQSFTYRLKEAGVKGVGVVENFVI